MKRFVLAALLLSGFSRAEAQVLTLEQAINIALERSLDIRIARNTLEGTIISNHISVAGGLPEVTGSLNNNQSLTNLRQELSNGTVTKRRGNQNNSLNGSISGTYVLFNGFRVIAARGRLEALEKQSEHLVNVEVQTVMANVMAKYYEIVRQQGYLQTLRQSIDVTLQRLNLVQARQSVGLANNADTYQAQLDLNATRQDFSSQELVLNQSKSDLLTLLTLRPDSAIEIRDTIIIDTAMNLANVTAKLPLNPELLSADEQVRVFEFLAREVNALRYPSVALNGGYNVSQSRSTAGFTLLNQNTGPFLGLNLQVPIFNGGFNKRQLRVAEIDTKNARITRESLYNNLQGMVVRAWQAYQNNLSRLQQEKANNKTAADLLSLVQKRFELGVGTVVDVREAQRTFVEAGFRLVELSYNAKLAEIELKRYAGELVF
ncbi:TolC family protein [Segetibacter sp. 3557_3]|uniref:TolC family protein n=1 Tax=Segetibacter sp. 3557_3 TaxID=2547429 RepID=UPI00105918A8|nr:TolC family protein [Segetibacter sp. 3557_3]TDH19710.1 TolC family protein [Segetibacter sp. 3557_3]